MILNIFAKIFAIFYFLRKCDRQLEFRIPHFANMLQYLKFQRKYFRQVCQQYSTLSTWPILLKLTIFFSHKRNRFGNNRVFVRQFTVLAHLIIAIFVNQKKILLLINELQFLFTFVHLSVSQNKCKFYKFIFINRCLVFFLRDWQNLFQFYQSVTVFIQFYGPSMS